MAAGWGKKLREGLRESLLEQLATLRTGALRGELHPVLQIRAGCRRWNCLPDEWLRQDAELTLALELADALEAELEQNEQIRAELAERSKHIAGED